MSTAILRTWWMTQRQLMVFARQPAYAVITLIQPVSWLFLFGGLFGNVVELGGFGTGSYLDYLVPGVVVTSALASNLWAGMGTLGGVGVAVLVAASVLPGTVFGALSNALGMRERESIIGVDTFLLLPLTFLSGAFMAPDGMPGWIRHAARFNPPDWAMVEGRSALSADPDRDAVLVRGGGLLALAVAAVWLSIRTIRTYRRSV
ncbi:ABC transporter permease [Streptomyces sp. FL07-04A]|uniref:ABC transporter permease n=1 Tax=Streptomyces sp. FL07-04A TaxID=3028658 RepID=UPI0029AF22D4|nr:ABC transporter permease [Streptomyces sp. FL07-04A]MDX3579380.1 ABC transporter permease [Streptomyces sp. FL07-04A]